MVRVLAGAGNNPEHTGTTNTHLRPESDATATRTLASNERLRPITATTTGRITKNRLARRDEPAQ